MSNIINDNDLFLCSFSITLEKDGDISGMHDDAVKRIQNNEYLAERLIDILMKHFGDNYDEFTAAYCDIGLDEFYISTDCIVKLLECINACKTTVNYSDDNSIIPVIKKLIKCGDRCKNNNLQISIYSVALKIITRYNLVSDMLDDAVCLNDIISKISLEDIKFPLFMRSIGYHF